MNVNDGHDSAWQYHQNNMAKGARYQDKQHPIYSDVWGPAQTSVSGHNYYVSFIDAYSRFTWLYLIKRKFDIFDVFIKFQTHVERLLSHQFLFSFGVTPLLPLVS